MRIPMVVAALVLLVMAVVAPICLRAQQTSHSVRPVSLASSVFTPAAKSVKIIPIDLGRRMIMSDSSDFQQKQPVAVNMSAAHIPTKARLIPFPVKIPRLLVASNK